MLSHRDWRWAASWHGMGMWQPHHEWTEGLKVEPSYRPQAPPQHTKGLASPQKVPLAGDHVFKPTSLWGHFISEPQQYANKCTPTTFSCFLCTHCRWARTAGIDFNQCKSGAGEWRLCPISCSSSALGYCLLISLKENFSHYESIFSYSFKPTWMGRTSKPCCILCRPLVYTQNWSSPFPQSPEKCPAD